MAIEIINTETSKILAPKAEIAALKTTVAAVQGDVTANTAYVDSLNEEVSDISAYKVLIWF